MIGIRHKLLLGYGGLIAIVAAIGVMTITQINELGGAVDAILTENYRSVVACQDMKESLERTDSGLLFLLAGHDAEGRTLIEQSLPRFREALRAEQRNITLPGEEHMAARIDSLFRIFVAGIPSMSSSQMRGGLQPDVYFTTLQPLFLEIKGVAQAILELNQSNMQRASEHARERAAMARQRMLVAIIASVLVAALFTLLTQRWVLRPVHRLIDSANEIRRGNLDLVVASASHDELGMLSDSFNDMAAALRSTRHAERLHLLRTRLATEEVFKVLPSFIAVLDLDGRVELATDAAARYFAFRVGDEVGATHRAWFDPLFRRALTEGRIIVADDTSLVQQFIDGHEHFFRPMVVPIPIAHEHETLTGVALILRDVTQEHEQRELKRGVVATVSHQLKTPLTSLRMSLHLLLDERVGPLNDTQEELVRAARDESERLVHTLDDLLDLSRMEGGRSHLDIQPVAPVSLVHGAAASSDIDARDHGVTLRTEVSDGLPPVAVDEMRIQHVFANLLHNALRHTSPGGTITVSARPGDACVEFAVDDTGCGISQEHLAHVFEPFYRVPGQDPATGVGLGLAIAREIVRAHGGEMSVESTPGMGSSFRFTLSFSA